MTQILCCYPPLNTSKASRSSQDKEQISSHKLHGRVWFASSPGLSCLRPTLVFCARAIPSPSRGPQPSDVGACAKVSKEATPTLCRSELSQRTDPLLGSSSRSCNFTFICVSLCVVSILPLVCKLCEVLGLFLFWGGCLSLYF